MEQPELTPAAKRSLARQQARERAAWKAQIAAERSRRIANGRAVLHPTRWRGGTYLRRRIAAFVAIVVVAWIGVDRGAEVRTLAPPTYAAINHSADAAGTVAVATRATVASATSQLAHAVRSVRHVSSRAVTRVEHLTQAPPLAHAQTHDVTIQSRSLGHTTDAIVILPKGYVRDAHLPVVYLLHAQGQTPEQLASASDLAGLTGATAAKPVIVVIPRGAAAAADDSEWSDAPSDRSNHWASFVSADLVAFVDAHYGTSRTAGGRNIVGVGMGGYGAVNIALRHPQVFGSASSWSGYFDASAQGASGMPGDAHWTATSPLQYLPTVAAAAKAHGLSITLHIVPGDLYTGENRAFASALARAHIAHHLDVSQDPLTLAHY